jgi:hypothetical protein
MATKMTRGSRTELAKTLRKRYLSATIKQKQTILKEFIAATGYHPKSAVRVLNATVEAKTPKTRHRRPLYDEAARTALIVFWEASDRRLTWQPSILPVTFLGEATGNKVR